jgi:type II secretion system protein H
MNRDQPRLGFSGPPGDWSSRVIAPCSFRRRERGFTLLEMIMVFVIMAVLAALAMPAMQSAFNEQALRKDTQQFALMVKTAMNQSAEQHKTYVMDLSETSIALHPQGEAAAPTVDEANTATFDDTTPPSGQSNAVDMDVTDDFDSANKLQIPDPIKANAWTAMPDATQWIFQPGELCPATRVRVARGEAWIEMSFNALTGDVQDESYSLQ